jgi:hypothetical protein
MNTTVKSLVLSIFVIGLPGCDGGDGGSAPNRQPAGLQVAPLLLQVAEDTALTAQLTATDPDGDSLAFSVATQASHGTVTITSAGAVTYVPAANYNGADAFSASASDGRGGSVIAAFNLTVTPVNDPPTITNTSLTFVEDVESTQSVILMDPERDAVSLEAVSEPSHGLLIGTTGAGEVIYLPNADYTGTDSFVARATDEHGAASADATIAITVTNVNDAPVAHDDEFFNTSGETSLDVGANDTDVDGDALAVTITSAPAFGTAVVNAGRIEFAPPNGFSGPVSIGYRVTDPGGLSSTATARVVVGSFSPLVYIEGSSKTQLYYYDGSTSTAINPTSNYQTYNFTFSGSGNKIAYEERHTMSDRGTIFIHDFAQPDSRESTPIRAYMPLDLKYTLDSDGSNLLSANKLDIGWEIETYLTRLVNMSLYDLVSRGSQTNFPTMAGVFNPVTSEYYFQAAHSNSVNPTPTSQAYFSLFAGTVQVPPLVQIGATYPNGNKSGSGFNIHVTADGRYVLHGSINNTTGAPGLLVNDRVTNTETDLYRAFVAGELPSTLAFDVNAAGTKACFRVNDPGAADAGPGRIWIAAPAAPGSATAVTPRVDSNGDCQWASDNKTLAYLSSNGGLPFEPWVVDITNPNVVSRVRETLANGESIAFFGIARKNLTAIIGINPAGGGAPQFYRADLAAPGTSVAIGSPGVTGNKPGYTLSADGQWLGYLKDETIGGTLTKRLHIMSTQVANFDIAIGAGFAEQFAFRPMP